MEPSGIVIDQPWLAADGADRIMRALTQGGGVVRFVGGCVRDALAGRPVRDMDMATDLLPDEVVRRLVAADIRAIPTGIDHGTVTAVASGRPFEVTTLRVDVETDGRRAVVAFTDSWKEDAGRRDFTFNALYCDPDGTVYDPTGGIADLKAGRVRFIGDPAQRIEEDALRILRFFRFHAWYGAGALDADGLAACVARQADLDRLSVERVRAEMLRLLEAPDPLPTLRAMAHAGVLARVLPEASSLHCLERLIGIGVSAPLLRLAALTSRRADMLTTLADRWKMSSREKARLRGMAAGEASAPAGLPEAEARQQIYWLGRDRFLDLVWLDWAADGHDRRGLVDLAEDWAPPAFPVKGADLLGEGIAPGERMGALLRALERQWVQEGFEPSRAELLARLDTLDQAP
ncbi:CCA tRNA nucleotidyltransferase [Iodidimonas sp. SYSU 1G8]|uniref:CCA tRNA nucleotidyltransferase n=1 Tax=Iodidimonas sp. SYSU 1G8 TaxID=3133967 RepID=UPI0031FE7D65